MDAALREFDTCSTDLNVLCVVAARTRPEFSVDSRGLSPLDERALADFASAPGSHSRLRVSCTSAELSASTVSSEVQSALASALQHASAPPAAPVIMGVVNVTPDSFSDGGRFTDPKRAVEHGLTLANEGALILDVGGESTRPGAQAVPLELELERVMPVVQGLAHELPRGVRISIDTQKCTVARAALAAGATMVNDIAAGTRPEEHGDMLGLIAETGADYVLMHMQGTPETMQSAPSYGDPVADVARYLRGRVRAAVARGIEPARLVIDPGIGFGKGLEHNLVLIRRLRELRSLGLPLLMGVSRKSFIAQVMEDRKDEARDRIGGTAAAVAACVQGGASILRVHDARIMFEAASLAYALSRAGSAHTSA